MSGWEAGLFTPVLYPGTLPRHFTPGKYLRRMQCPTSPASALVSVMGLTTSSRLWSQRPRSHMMTNIYAESDEHGITLRFRILAFIGKGRTSTASYYDKIVKTDNGWRTQHRYVSSRRRDKRDAEVDLNGIAL